MLIINLLILYFKFYAVCLVVKGIPEYIKTLLVNIKGKTLFEKLYVPFEKSA
ncbi:hypothetical protein BA6E_121236 [Bacteroidales bacterium 6E]|nr:hypothetical protein BA6E_121236 [Bacteroidales bacterium 6E]